MTKRKIDRCADFELTFTATGSVQLRNVREDKLIWSSDDDEDFAEEFDGDFFDGNDEDEICEYLAELGLIEDDSPIDVIEEDADESDDEVDDLDDEDDFDDDNVIDADFTPSRKPKR